MSSTEPPVQQHDQDTKDLMAFGYQQELQRELSTFSSFAVAFSYISPSTGIFTLFYLGLIAVGGYLFWAWPVVVLGQMFVALNFAELSSHFPIAGSVFQWTKYLSGRTYSWFTGWIYLFAGVITVAAVVATLPIALLPMLNNMFGWTFNTALGSTDQLVAAIVTLVLITILNIYGVKLVAVINNTGVVFEILGMVVFALIMAIVHNNQGIGVLFDSGDATLTGSTFLIGMFMSLFVVYGFDTAGTLAEETKNPRAESPKAILGSIAGAFVIGAIFLIGTLMAIPNLGGGAGGLLRPPGGHRSGVLVVGREPLPAGRGVRDLRLLPVDHDVDRAVDVRDGARQPAAVLEAAREGQPTVAHADRRLRRRRDPGGDPVPAVHGRHGDRGRGDGDDLPQLLPREPGRDAGADEGMAEGRRSLQARGLGQADQRPGAAVGRRDAVQPPVVDE